MTITVVPSLVVVDEKGEVWIEGTRMKVKFIAIEHRHGRTPKTIQKHHSHLTLSQIYAALSYYYAHQADMDAEIEQDQRIYREAWEAQQADPAFQERRARLLARWEALQKQQEHAS